MDPQKTLSQALEIVKLKESAMQAIAKDTSALQPALIITVLGVLFGALGTTFFPVRYGMGMVINQPDVGSLVVSILVSSFLAIFWLYLTGFLAERFFHSKLNTQGFVKVIGHANILSFALLYPPLGLVAGIWGFVVFCRVQSKVGKLDTGSIALLILLQILIFFGVGIMSNVV